ncbi:amino acid ABC transporter permease [Tepidiforma sp.]|uniref:amino acid ABC transporter permease n=1 Tax=Tepidiforma sp. TaxID=2682230 RepID=UPI00260C4C4C|nr:amino acid ABC transporter permease [Tepidiforma sp.]MCX7616584.1 amino acid ABC transporter permease [Tepidiforma sp.]
MPALAVDWTYIAQNFFSEIVLRGVWMTLQLSVIGMALGILLGTLFALARVSRQPVLRGASLGYIWFFRGTPLLVQIVFWYFALPQAWPSWAPWNGQLSPFQTGILALAINEGAYMTEIVRAGIQSVDPGQMEAARALGMTHRLAMRRIILPQALRVIIPPTGNEFIAMLKNSSLVSLISVRELFLVAKLQYSSTLLYFEWLIIASGWYLILTTIGSVFQSWLEHRYGAASFGPGPGRRWLSFGAKE